MMRPENTPTSKEEYTSLVRRARPSAKSGGTMDQAPVEISSKPSMNISLQQNGVEAMRPREGGGRGSR